MEKLNLPLYDFTITRTKEGKLMIFDTLRKLKIPLTPEEWVRQHILKFLMDERNFPPALISVEAGIRINRILKRYDALVYDRNKQPLVLIECKAPGVKVNQKTFDQIAIYNRSVRAKYLLVTNGLSHYCCKLDLSGNKYDFLEDIPYFGHLIS
jgi:hypothetical protein